VTTVTIRFNAPSMTLPREEVEARAVLAAVVHECLRDSPTRTSLDSLRNLFCQMSRGDADLLGSIMIGFGAGLEQILVTQHPGEFREYEHQYLGARDRVQRVQVSPTQYEISLSGEGTMTPPAVHTTPTTLQKPSPPQERRLRIPKRTPTTEV
jgi:hypothetical protein